MKYFLFDTNLDEKKFSEFLDFVNQNKDEEINIIFDNCGGKSAYGAIMIKMINDAPTMFCLTGIRLFSTGFIIFSKAKCKKILVPECVGAHHRARFLSIDILTNGKPVWDGDIAVLSASNVDQESIDQSFMNDDELKKYNAGDDVYFNSDRMREIFPEAEII